MTDAMLMALFARATKGDPKAFDSFSKCAEKLQLLAPPPNDTKSQIPSHPAFTWTEEDESLRPFIEHIKGCSKNPGERSISKGGLPDPDPEFQDGDIRHREEAKSEKEPPPE
jgi:hypothetical protein